MHDIVIVDENCDITVERSLFLRFKTMNKDVVHRIESINSLTINPSTSITGEAIELISENNKSMSLMDNSNEVIGRWHGDYPGDQSQLHYLQMSCIYKKVGLQWSAGWILDKIGAQLDWMTDQPIDISDLRGRYEVLSTDHYQDIFDHEGHLSKKYYAYLNELLPSPWQFSIRSRQPALDPFNALLNYSYAILYQVVESGILRAGLDPYLGFHHSIVKGGKSLVYDMIDGFRPWIDEAVFQYALENADAIDLIAEQKDGAVIITKKAKTELLPRIHEQLNGIIRYKGRQLSRKNHIYLEALKLKTKIKRHGQVE